MRDVDFTIIGCCQVSIRIKDTLVVALCTCYSYSNLVVWSFGLNLCFYVHGSYDLCIPIAIVMMDLLQTLLVRG